MCADTFGGVRLPAADREAGVNHLMWVLGSELRSSGRTSSLLTAESPSSPLIIFLTQDYIFFLIPLIQDEIIYDGPERGKK